MVVRHEDVPVRHTVRVHAHIAHRGTVGRHRLLLHSNFFHVNHQHFLQEGIVQQYRQEVQCRILLV